MKTRSLSRWTALAAGLVLALFASPLSSHEGHHHTALGTIRSLEATQLELETKEGKTLVFVLTDKTLYKHGNSTVSREHLKAAARVAVMYELKDGRNVAIEIKLGAMSTEQPGSAE